jgi:hypothetical protein
MCKYSLSAICFTLVSLSFGVSAKGTEALIKSKIQELSHSCPSVPFYGTPKTAVQMFCSGGFNELVIRHCVRANFDLEKYDESISISYSTFDNNKDMKVNVEMKCSDIEI